ncbi:hypothetical protein QL285_071787 [Trifolium repens]|nr:hypothetical protein QL285_071787 [Trifolium repens]
MAENISINGGYKKRRRNTTQSTFSITNMTNEDKNHKSPRINNNQDIYGRSHIRVRKKLGNESRVEDGTCENDVYNEVSASQPKR